MTTLVDNFKVALGEEDGQHFAAIMWPENIGEMPFTQKANLAFLGNGFSLFAGKNTEAFAFDGVSEETLFELRARQIVILKQEGDTIKQVEVVKVQ